MISVTRHKVYDPDWEDFSAIDIDACVSHDVEYIDVASLMFELEKHFGVSRSRIYCEAETWCKIKEDQFLDKRQQTDDMC